MAHAKRFKPINITWGWLRARRKEILFASTSFLLLFLSFQGNIFGVGVSQTWFAEYEKFSSLIIEKTARCKDNGFYGGPLVPSDKNTEGYMESMANDDCSLENFAPYSSQFGLQARVIALFAPSDNQQLSRYFKLTEAVLAALSALVFTIFLLYVRKLFGVKVASFVLATIALSVWVVAYGRNLYWIEFLMFLPFVFVFVSYEWFKKRRLLWVLYALLFPMVLAKLLNGYEHVSTLLLSIYAAIAFHEYYAAKTHVSIKNMLLKGAAVLGIGVAALGTAILLNAAGLAAHYGSFNESLDMVTNRAEERGISGVIAMQENVVGGFRATSPEVAKYINYSYDLDQIADGNAHPLKYALLSTLNYLTLPAISLPIVMREPFGSLLQSTGFMLIVMIIVLWNMPRLKIKKNIVKALRVSFYIGLAGTLSWLILMPAHMYPHPHLNGIIFYLPTFLIGYIATALSIAALFKKNGR